MVSLFRKDRACYVHGTKPRIFIFFSIMSTNINTPITDAKRYTLPSEIYNLISQAQQVKTFAENVFSCSDAVANRDLKESANNLITAVLCVASTIFVDSINEYVGMLEIEK